MDSTTQVITTLIIVLALAVTVLVTQFIRRRKEAFPMRIIPAYAAIPLLIAFKYGKPRRYLFDFLEWHTKPRVYCGIERDSQQKAMYLKEDQPECL